MIQAYPHVLSESETLELAHEGRNLARYGDGELKLCAGRNCISQPFDPNLASELKRILVGPASGCLPCIPNVTSTTPKSWFWNRFSDPEWTVFYKPGAVYGSSFITRPDSAPWIDTPAYWERVVDLWRGRNVVLVAGTDRSLRAETLAEASTVLVVHAPSGKNGDGAYARIDQLQEEIGRPSGPVLLCVGATATVLADRLARAGTWAIDLGHIGMFMRAAGAYRVTKDELVSPHYTDVLLKMHGSERWGDSAYRRSSAVAAFADELGAKTILDYGCGRGTLKPGLAPICPARVDEYDPGIPDKSAAPKPADLVVSIDVLEHVEPDRIDKVLAHIHSLALDGAYLSIATRPAIKTLPDGRNAHLIVKPASWWLEKLSAHEWTHSKQPANSKDRDLTVWLKR